MTDYRILIATTTTALCLVSVPAHAEKKKQHVHDHGSAKLSIAVDGQTVGFDLDTPAQGLYGFEYEPKTDADKKTFSDANARFTSGATELFKFPADLDCQVTKGEIKKEGAEEQAEDPKKDEKKSKSAPKETHSDMNASVVFNCSKPLTGAKVTIALIKAFPRIKQLKVQVNTGTKQGAETVTQPEQEVGL